jgi:cytochrome c oxidase cbb3-type subunit III
VRRQITSFSLALTAVLLWTGHIVARPQARGAQPPNINSPRTAYPLRAEADPVVVARGKELYGLHCGFCHGQDARGGSEGGPNLLRSQVVLNDQNAELVIPVVQNGRGAMPKLDLTPAQITDVVTFVHSFAVGGYDISRERPASILVGDAKAGEMVFNAKCAVCHSATGDLSGFGSRSEDPIVLQQAWLVPSGGRGGEPRITDVPPITATVTLPSGQTFEGRLMRIDDFIIALQLPDETHRSFRRNGDVPNVEIHDPMAAHKALLRTYTDKDIHDLTAYLARLR